MMLHTKISTRHLLKLLLKHRGKTIEASLNNGLFNATHSLRLGKRTLFDCGIDSETTSWKAEDFLTQYREAWWMVEQIV